jgi:iron(III) transport system substrate-binding protein
MRSFWRGGLAAVLVLAVGGGAALADGEVNVYTSRHYKFDDQLYAEFTAETGIAVNVIEGKGDELMERIKAEGANSPADVFVTVDAGMLWRAEQAGLFQPTQSDLLVARIPENLRHPDGLWYGFSKRARVFVIDATRVDAALVQRYEDLARPELKGQVCIRSSSNIYNLSLLGSLIASNGLEAAEAWARGVVANMAREPEGGDTDQIKGVAAGVCGVAVTNTYYFVRLLTSDKPEEVEMAKKLTLVFPNQTDRGTHVNVSGAGVAAHAPNKDNAVKLLEFLASDAAQGYFAQGNNEYPVVAGVAPNAAVVALGQFKEDSINVVALGTNQPEAQKVFDRAGWK